MWTILEREIPVLYFLPEDKITGKDVESMTTLEDAYSKGGVDGIIVFTVEDLENPSLYTINDKNTSWVEKPGSLGCQVVPLVYFETMLDGVYSVGLKIGSFTNAVFDWDSESDLEIVAYGSSAHTDFFGVEEVILDLYAWDYDIDGYCYAYYNLDCTILIVLAITLICLAKVVLRPKKHQLPNLPPILLNLNLARSRRDPRKARKKRTARPPRHNQKLDRKRSQIWYNVQTVSRPQNTSDTYCTRLHGDQENDA